MAKKCQWEGEMEKEVVIKQNRGTMETNQCQQQTERKEAERRTLKQGDPQHTLTEYLLEEGKEQSIEFKTTFYKLI